MNALPVSPSQVASTEDLAKYFGDIERWNFDIAYNAFYAMSHKDVTETYATVYTDFANEAKKQGVPSCIQIQSTVCAGDKVPASEAQYNLDNTPDKWGEGGFFASFASTAWKDYLKELTTLFVQEYGFEWVVFEEPMYRVDIPGTEDHFYQVFKERYPELPYPESREETEGYLAVQKLKADLLVEFYADLTAHAKSVGAKKVGIMPWFFIPTVENTPEGTLNTSCDIGRIHSLEHLDFLVVRMQPDNILAGVMRTGDDFERSPLLYYPEVLAQQLGKPVMAVNNPSDEHTDYPSLPLIPIEFFKKATLASLAAAPNGMTRHWYSQNYGKDTEHMEFMRETNARVSRLGDPVSPVAFVFSYSGGRHAEPKTNDGVWKFYWSLAKKMLFDERRPMLTLYADSLADDLAMHPEVQVLILEAHFPLTSAQAQALRKWWLARPGRSIVAFSGGEAYSADIRKPGVWRAEDAFHSLLPALGVREPEADAAVSQQDISLSYVGRVKRSNFLGDSVKVNGKVQPVARVFGSGSKILYSTANDEPVIVETRQKGSLGLFCGFELSDATADLAAKAVNYAIETVDAPVPAVRSSSDGVLWSETRSGYVVIANCSEQAGKAEVNATNLLLWDIVGQEEMPPGIHEIAIPAYGYKIFRRISRRAKLLDIEGAVWITGVADGTSRADISLLAGKKTAFYLKTPPREVYVDGEYAQISLDKKEGYCIVEPAECPPGDHEIVLKW